MSLKYVLNGAGLRLQHQKWLENHAHSVIRQNPCIHSFDSNVQPQGSVKTDESLPPLHVGS